MQLQMRRVMSNKKYTEQQKGREREKEREKKRRERKREAANLSSTCNHITWRNNEANQVFLSLPRPRYLPSWRGKPGKRGKEKEQLDQGGFFPRAPAWNSARNCGDLNRPCIWRARALAYKLS